MYRRTRDVGWEGKVGSYLMIIAAVRKIKTRRSKFCELALKLVDRR